MGFPIYLKRAAWIALWSSLALALVAAVAVAMMGDTSFKLNATISFERFDGLWLVLLVPAVGVSLTALLSPLSYLLYRAFTRRQP